jgi:hypothetical protein
MASVTGEAARYVSQQVIRKSKRRLTLIFLMGYAAAFASGLLVGYGGTMYSLLFIPAFVTLIVILDRRMDTISEKLERERLSYFRGATGEAQVGYVLGGLSDDYVVLHDLTTSHGNIDHVVVGPSGVYLIETKNWKGVVTADGKGELLLDGKSAPKPPAKTLFVALMNMKDEIKALTGLKPFFNGVLVFPSARVEAKWGTTGYVDCVGDEQLIGYITRKERSKRLAKEEIDAISQAFYELAMRDRDFARASA